RALEELGGAGHVPAGNFEASDDQVALDGLHLSLDDLLERTGRAAGGGDLHLGGRGVRRLPAQRRRQVVRSDARPLREEDGALEHVLQLADVAWPGVGSEARQRLVLDPAAVLA